MLLGFWHFVLFISKVCSTERDLLGSGIWFLSIQHELTDNSKLFPAHTEEDVTSRMLAFIPSVSNNEKLTNLGHCNLQGAEAKHLLCEWLGFLDFRSDFLIDRVPLTPLFYSTKESDLAPKQIRNSQKIQTLVIIKEAWAFTVCVASPSTHNENASWVFFFYSTILWKIPQEIVTFFPLVIFPLEYPPTHSLPHTFFLILDF